MAFRSDLTFNWDLSPRVITILSPSTLLNLQDLVDTCRTVEAYMENLTYPTIILAAGKDNLGGGLLVGITAILQNAVIAFEDRSGPTYAQCTINGGNLVAIDSFGSNISPIQPTSFTQVITSASSSSTLITGGSALTSDQAQQLVDARKFALLGFIK
ncbi:MAG TPA: hypothetical protein VII94_05920 [Candidatus Saccharimonadales bacterium]